MISFYNRTSNNLSDINKLSGDHLIFVNDTGEIFVDHNNKRVKYSDIELVSRASYIKYIK